MVLSVMEPIDSATKQGVSHTLAIVTQDSWVNPTTESSSSAVSTSVCNLCKVLVAVLMIKVRLNRYLGSEAVESGNHRVCGGEGIGSGFRRSVCHK